MCLRIMTLITFFYFYLVFWLISGLANHKSSNADINDYSESDASASRSTSLSCTSTPLTKRERWITSDCAARLRCYMGIKASLPAHEQERLSRHLREEVRSLAGIPRSYPYTMQEYKRQGMNIWMDMITRIVRGMKRNRWNEELAEEVLKDIIHRGRQNAKRRANKQKKANGEAVTLGRLKKSRDDTYRKEDEQLLCPANIQKSKKEVHTSLQRRKTRKHTSLRPPLQDLDISLVNSNVQRQARMAPLVVSYPILTDINLYFLITNHDFIIQM